jgi:hypothetical protein
MFNLRVLFFSFRFTNDLFIGLFYSKLGRSCKIARVCFVLMHTDELK